MRKGLLLGAALLVMTVAPSATYAQKATKGGPEFVGDALSQVFVPIQSVAGQPAAAPAKAAPSKKAKRSKKAKKSSKKSKKSAKKSSRKRS